MAPLPDGKTLLGCQARLVGVWCVQLLLKMLLAGLLLLLLIWFLPVRLELQFRQHNRHAAVWARVAVAWWRVSRAVNLTERLAGILDKALDGQPAETVEPVPQPPANRIWRRIEQPVRRLLRKIGCRKLDLQVVVGGGDAMASALLAGCAHALVGAGLGFVSHWIRLPRPAVRIQVAPSFQEAVLRVRLDCILVLRAGDAIVAGIWSVHEMRKDPDLMAWFKQQRRSKGVEGSVRTSDSGPDEDRHGEPEADGGREHGGGRSR